MVSEVTKEKKKKITMFWFANPSVVILERNQINY